MNKIVITHYSFVIPHSGCTLNSRPKITDLIHLVIKRVAPDWENLGLQLIPAYEVNIISADHKLRGVVVCCRVMLLR